MDITTTILIYIQAFVLGYTSLFIYINNKIVEENQRALETNNQILLQRDFTKPLKEVIVTVWCYPFQKIYMSDGTLRKNKAS